MASIEELKHIRPTRIQLTAVLYENFPISLIGLLLIASILFWELRGFIEPFLLGGWYAIFCMICVGRIALYRWYLKTKSSVSFNNTHYYFFMLGACLTASLFGMLASVLMPDDFSHQVLILIIISGILVGSAQSLSSSYLAAMSYLVIIMLPLLTWELLQILQGNKIYIPIFVTMTFYCFFSGVVTFRSYQLLTNHIKSQLENKMLLDNLSKSKLDLQNSHNNLKKYTAQVEFLNKMDELLTLTINEKEIFTIAIQYILKIFPDISGGIFLLMDLNKKLVCMAQGGGIGIQEQEFSAEDCWAIRQRSIHLGRADVRCPHCHESDSNVCVPLVSQGELMGTLYLLKQEGDFALPEISFIHNVANAISIGMMNIRLKGALQEQAMRDPLTGLYNLRFLRESLMVHLSQTKRSNNQLSLMMLDIDFFKKLNDTFGHEAGDTALISLSQFLKGNVREGDIVCRYGGEEFMVVLPDTSLEVAIERAELLRKNAKLLSVTWQETLLPQISLSFGIAVYPMHGSTSEEMMEAADKALYEAKNSGRDRICVAKEIAKP